MEETVEEESINSVSSIQQLLHSVIESASDVQILKGKWLIITTKLTTLLNRFSDLSVRENTISSDFLRSVAVTCSTVSSLAAVCRSTSPPAGKLKTQNETDIVSAKLDAHINDLEVLVKSGVLSENAIVQLPVSNRRDSVRIEIENLITRLQIGSIESKSLVLDLLLGLLQEDDKNVFIAVSQGIVPILVNLLDSSSSSEIKEKTVAVFSKISIDDSSKHVLSAEGFVLLNNLLRVLESGSVFAKEKSCIALKLLSNSKENARTIVSRGGVSSLIEICQEGTPNSQALAAGVLRNLAVFEEIKGNIIEENAISALLGLCNSGTALAQENSFGCLCNLVSGNDDIKLRIAREGGIECLINFWDSAPPPQNLEVVVQMVGTLASCPTIAELLVANAFLNRVVGVLNSPIQGVRVAAAKVLYELSYNNKTRKEIGEMDCICLLVNMLDSKAIEEKAAAVDVLSVLMNYDGNRRIFSKNEKGIVYVVRLLDPTVKIMNKKSLVSILGAFVHSKKCRNRMVAAGARDYLQKLDESNVEGANKLLHSLGQRRLLCGILCRRH